MMMNIFSIMLFVSSLNWSLRSEAHFELAKIEEDIEQLDSAKNNLLKVEYFSYLPSYCQAFP